ncbi:MAG: ATP-binding protein [Acidimicrobiales bacterium]
MREGSRPNTPLALFRREAELTALRQSVAYALNGASTITLVVGPAGIGKTRFTDELAVEVPEQGVRVVRGEASPTSREPLRTVGRSAVAGDDSTCGARF